VTGLFKNRAAIGEIIPNAAFSLSAIEYKNINKEKRHYDKN
jgi:hypothetical protein